MRIGNIELSSRVALAPMAGVTDVAFRQICSELGAALTCTELISSKALCYRDKKTFSLLTQFPGEHPGAVQIFGSDPVCMAEAAQIALEEGSGSVAEIAAQCGFASQTYFAAKFREITGYTPTAYRKFKQDTR